MTKKQINLKNVTISHLQDILYKQNGEQPIGKRAYTEQHTNVRLYLYYDAAGNHFGTYNRDTRSGWHFAETAENQPAV